MTDQEWYQLCEANWHKAAAKLIAAGYTQVEQENDIIPAIFTKGPERVYLARSLGSCEWYTVEAKDGKV